MIKKLSEQMAQGNVPYVKVYRNGMCVNPITKDKPYRNQPIFGLKPTGSKFHK